VKGAPSKDKLNGYINKFIPNNKSGKAGAPFLPTFPRCLFFDDYETQPKKLMPGVEFTLSKISPFYHHIPKGRQQI
jgi:hypothetical protein